MEPHDQQIDTTMAARDDAGATAEFRYDVFLCHNSQDVDFIAGLERALTGRGLKIFRDHTNLRRDRSNFLEIERSLLCSRVIAVCLGPHGIGPVQNEEIDVAIDLSCRKQSRRMVILLPGASPEIPRLFLRNRSRVVFKIGPDEIEPLDQLCRHLSNPDVTESAPPPTVQPSPVFATLDIALDNSGGQVVWSGPFPPDEAAKLWDHPLPVARIRLGFAPADQPALARSVLRLLCHIPIDAFPIETPFKDDWKAGANRAMRNELPSDITVSARWKDPISPILFTGGQGARNVTPGKLAAIIDMALQDWCVNRLDCTVRTWLEESANALFEVEACLAADMLTLWHGHWFPELTKDDVVLNRFLDGLVAATDSDRPASRFGLCRHGVDTCMAPAVLLMLAVAECGKAATGGPLQPDSDSPGNLRGVTLRAHGCGVQRIAGDSIEVWWQNQTRFPWESRLVVLGGCTAEPATLKSNFRRLGTLSGDQGWLRAELSWPAIVTRDRTLREKLAQGRTAVTTHLARLLRHLHHQQVENFKAPDLSPRLRPPEAAHG